MGFRIDVYHYDDDDRISLILERVNALDAQGAQLMAKVDDLKAQLSAFKLAHPDFDTVLVNLQHVDVPRAVTDVLINSPAGLAILYHFANDLEEANPCGDARRAPFPPPPGD
jgi:hypothetical protein